MRISEFFCAGCVSAPLLILHDSVVGGSNTSGDFIQCSKKDLLKFRIMSTSDITSNDVYVHDLSTYNMHMNSVLNIDGGLNVRNSANVPKFIVLNVGSVFAEAPFQSKPIVIQNPQKTGSNLYVDYIVCQEGDNDVFKVDNTVGIWSSALMINNPVQTGYNLDGNYLHCGSVLKLDCIGNIMFPKLSIL